MRGRLASVQQRLLRGAAEYLKKQTFATPCRTHGMPLACEGHSACGTSWQWQTGEQPRVAHLNPHGLRPDKGQSPRIPIGALPILATSTGMTLLTPGGFHLSTGSKHNSSAFDHLI